MCEGCVEGVISLLQGIVKKTTTWLNRGSNSVGKVDQMAGYYTHTQHTHNTHTHTHRMTLC